MVVLTMEIVETAGRVVGNGRDSWWSSLIVWTAGGCRLVSKLEVRSASRLEASKVVGREDKTSGLRLLCLSSM